MGLKELPNLPEQIAQTVAQLNAKNYGKLDFQYLDPSSDPNLEQATKQYQLMSLKWPALSDGKIQPGDDSRNMGGRGSLHYRCIHGRCPHVSQQESIL